MGVPQVSLRVEASDTRRMRMRINLRHVPDDVLLRNTIPRTTLGVNYRNTTPFMVEIVVQSTLPNNQHNHSEQQQRPLYKNLKFIQGFPIS